MQYVTDTHSLVWYLFEQLILKHKEKIATEKAKAAPDTRLIHYWEREIKVYVNEMEKAKKRLERGG